MNRRGAAPASSTAVVEAELGKTVPSLVPVPADIREAFIVATVEALLLDLQESPAVTVEPDKHGRDEDSSDAA
jgi:hypothetical protein